VRKRPRRGEKSAGALCCVLAATTTSLAGYLHPVYLGTVPMFFVLLLQGFFGGNSAISNPYMAEMWPGFLRASGLRLLFGLSNLEKFIGPAGLAVIIGVSNYVNQKLRRHCPWFSTISQLLCARGRCLPSDGIEPRGAAKRHRDFAPPPVSSDYRQAWEGRFLGCT
jgi:hypothetical protein